ncbi:Uncharacterised protein [Clostridium sporogenes]|nr:Uncharacterised protein [Clostridium sporogenes]
MNGSIRRKRTMRCNAAMGSCVQTGLRSSRSMPPARRCARRRRSRSRLSIRIARADRPQRDGERCDAGQVAQVAAQIRLEQHRYRDMAEQQAREQFTIAAQAGRAFAAALRRHASPRGAEEQRDQRLHRESLRIEREQHRQVEPHERIRIVACEMDE